MPDKKISRREFLAKSAAGAAAVAFGTAGGLAPSRAMGANDRMSIGVIGVGGRGFSLMNELDRADKERATEVTAICDTWRPRREMVAQKVNDRYGADCRTFSDYEDLLALGDIDAVIIATPDFAHARIMIDALKAGKDIYVEKPMATNFEDAKEAFDAAAVSDRVVQVGTQRRSSGIWKGAAKAVQSGVLGKISRVEIGWNDCKPRWLRGYSDVKEEDVNWKRYLMDLPYRPFDPKQYKLWHFYRDFTNGTIALLGSHYIDVVAWLMNAPFPRTAVANGGHYVWDDGREHEDTLYAIYDYPEGFACRYASGLGNSAESGCRIYGTNGMFSESGFKITGAGGKGNNVVKEEMKIEPEAGEDHMRNWLDCIRSRKTPNAPVEAGYQHSIACVMGYQALITGRKMRYMLDLRRIVEV